VSDDRSLTSCRPDRPVPRAVCGRRDQLHPAGPSRLSSSRCRPLARADGRPSSSRTVHRLLDVSPSISVLLAPSLAVQSPFTLFLAPLGCPRPRPPLLREERALCNDVLHVFSFLQVLEREERALSKERERERARRGPRAPRLASSPSLADELARLRMAKQEMHCTAALNQALTSPARRRPANQAKLLPLPRTCSPARPP